jgi:hypothetical protein
MARHAFGGSAEDWIFEENTDDIPVLQGGAVLTFWTDRVGGSQITDIAEDLAGTTPITELTTSSGGSGYRIGQIPVFFGPPDRTQMWVSADGGDRVSIDALDIGDLAELVNQTLAAHMAQLNGHDTGVGNLTDVEIATPASRVVGDVLGVVDAEGTLGLLTPSQVSGAVLLNPPLQGGTTYVGNIVQPPPSTQGEPWLQMRQPYSAGDNNPDAIQLFSTHSNGTTPIKTGWSNGNNEGRDAPSTANRIARRVFEFYESLGGPSTSRFFELSTNPAISANREPLFGAYGTGHSTQPGWMVATRVLAGLLGVRAGGNYNSLSAINFRGVRATTGAPASGTWVTNDIVLDSAGTLYLCTAGGTPGTWTSGGGGGGGGTPATTFVNITPGTDMSHGTKSAATRLDEGGSVARLRGTLTATGAVSSGAVLATIPTVAHRPLAEVNSIVRWTGGGAKFTIATNGQITMGNSLTAAQSVWLDSITWDLVA